MDTIGSTHAQIAGFGKEVLNKRLSAEVILSAKSFFFGALPVPACPSPLLGPPVAG
jgi:hypothetical protein